MTKGCAKKMRGGRGLHEGRKNPTETAHKATQSKERGRGGTLSLTLTLSRSIGPGAARPRKRKKQGKLVGFNGL